MLDTERCTVFAIQASSYRGSKAQRDARSARKKPGG
jgi:hypothetical protein